ncbi:exo-alpha-sialidase [Fibrella aquatilis]|uniref:Exo-alpha-sialidase n=1 Tax=Fibrella aquatilis TaxID=2817059 RepID=A0A939K3K3_9BACT|nr:exo-alpha-sialidase [Fibrella aquatilis]MBO0934435.1 exo-alpha-sialidase [Fibrella aquatilis]
MNTILSMLLLLAAALAEKPIREITVSNPRFNSTTPRFTTNQQGHPVLTWAEKETDKQAAFYMAVSADGGQTFGQKIRIPAPANLSVHAEGMPKVAVKTDGTVMALFEVPRPVESSRFAGDLLFTTSSDGGKTWTGPKPLHQNTAPGKSHSFADLTRLPNGQIGVVWLDDKMPGYEGRPVKFVQTLPQGGFSPEIVVDSNVCQCCRTNVFVDSKQQIHLAYRDMLPDPNGEIAARDISHAISTDGGKTFGPPAVLVADNWCVNACPHAGPSVAETGEGVFVTWFSGKENAIGLRLAQVGNPTLVGEVLSNRAKHPQVVAQNNRLIWLWDESMKLPGQPADEPLPKYTQRIALRAGPTAPTTYLTPETVSATYPVALAAKQGLLVAFEQKTGDQKAVIVTQLIASPTN